MVQHRDASLGGAQLRGAMRHRRRRHHQRHLTTPQQRRQRHPFASRRYPAALPPAPHAQARVSAGSQSGRPRQGGCLTYTYTYTEAGLPSVHRLALFGVGRGRCRVAPAAAAHSLATERHPPEALQHGSGRCHGDHRARAAHDQPRVLTVLHLLARAPPLHTRELSLGGIGGGWSWVEG